jgi:type I pantothenate kinase
MPASTADVIDVFLPLSRLLHLRIAATRSLLGVVESAFLGRPAASVPYIIGIAGRVAVGKSTFARLLQAVLSRWPDRPRVDLVTTDGFLWPREVLERRELMERKGFPESYDQAALLDFVMAVNSGCPEVTSHVYSHITYDIVPDQTITVRHPDVLIIEGLNVLQPSRPRASGAMGSAVSDFFDFSVYVDAPEQAIKQWFLTRFSELRTTAFTDPQSYFRQFASVPDDEAIAMASNVWDTTNGPNLRLNIQPTRNRATVVIGKNANHDIDWIQIRKL